MLLADLTTGTTLQGKKNMMMKNRFISGLTEPDLYYEVGAGLDFYLPYFKLSVELKMSNGMRDVLVKDSCSGTPGICNAIEKMKSQIWVISFHFE